MAEPNGQEILSWALINRARLDPAGEAARYGINLNEGPVRDFSGNVHTITTTSKQPVAWNSALFAVADQHSQDMLTRQTLFHNDQGTHEANLRAAGYSFSSWGENVSESAPLGGAFDSTQAIYAHHEALFVDSSASGRGHRYNIMLDTYQEVGVGEVVGSIHGGTRSLLTQDFGRPSAATQFLTGIAYNDTSADAFYSVGEGRVGITVSTTAGNVATGPAGYFSRAVNVGTQTVTFSGGDLAAAVSVSITIAEGRNALVDLVGQSTVETSVSLTALNGVTKIIGLGNLGLTLTGNGADNTIVTALGNDILDGAGGVDTAVFSGNRANYTITNNANGSMTVTGAQGTDTLISIERIQFADQLYVPAGSGPGSVSIGDAAIVEGHNGTQQLVFTVTRTGGTAAFNVNFATADATATTADGDYVANSGTLQFAANENSKTMSVTINGDTKVEGNEAFNVVLSSATAGATISDNTAVGTINNDDVAAVAGSVSISDAVITEGNAGTQTMTFTVARTGGTAAFSVNYATANNTATSGSDYVAASGTLSFASGETTKQVSVTINGDATVESNETFFVNLSSPTNGATVSDSQGIGTINNDDLAGSISINDVSVTEGHNGTKVMTFTVTRTDGTSAFNVNFATSNGTATTTDGDYVANSGVIQFAANENTKTVSITINGRHQGRS